MTTIPTIESDQAYGIDAQNFYVLRDKYGIYYHYNSVAEAEAMEETLDEMRGLTSSHVIFNGEINPNHLGTESAALAMLYQPQNPMPMLIKT